MSQKVLVLDDDLVAVDIIALLVATLGYTAVRCSDEIEAMRRLKEEHFDLLLANYIMPKISGVKIIEQLRNSHIGIPAILMISGKLALNVENIDRLGVLQILKKPFVVAELAQALNFSLPKIEEDSSKTIIVTSDGYFSKSISPHPISTVPST